ncbi:MAG TPA: saccharopine dehydrogenase NADP-binding domain-containing protein [Phenylobacterium sp.]|nr:saccharopine dehydrogenase NADP-binding domain-containing protein [Phenylobacterium sp.]
MTTSNSSPSPRTQTVAVYGASGHTGRFVVADLLRRGLTPIGVVRDPAKLAAQAAWAQPVTIRTAILDDPASLDAALGDVAVVINCAGPFLDTADAVAAAAVRAGAHYLDVTAEQASATATLDRFDGPAREAGVLVLPAMGFYGGLADLLAAAAAGDWDQPDEIEVGIALDSWRPTQGTRLTGARNTATRLIVSEGRLRPLPQPAPESTWEFALPFGRQDMVALPLSEVVLIARRTQARLVRTWLNRAPLKDLNDDATPPPQAIDARGRSAQVFQMDVVVRKGRRTRRVSARGQDIYAFTAPLVCEAVARILAGEARGSGAQTPAAVFDAQNYLAALAPDLECVFTAADAPTAATGT